MHLPFLSSVSQVDSVNGGQVAEVCMTVSGMTHKILAEDMQLQEKAGNDKDIPMSLLIYFFSLYEKIIVYNHCLLSGPSSCDHHFYNVST